MRGTALLARICTEYGITLMYISSDYVFDGTHELHDEEEPFSPLSVYGQSKAAGDLAVSGCPKHYILHSYWVIGDGDNFVKTMVMLSNRVADSKTSWIRLLSWMTNWAGSPPRRTWHRPSSTFWVTKRALRYLRIRCSMVRTTAPAQAISRAGSKSPAPRSTSPTATAAP